MNATDTKITFIPYSEEYHDSYLSFARKNWGKTCYQQNKNYLEWLYQDNPSPKASKNSCSIAVDSQNNVVGVIHKLFLPWKIDDEIIEVATIHNLLVDPNYRQGNGLFLITNSFKGEDHVFISGVNPPLSQAYAALKAEKLHVFWHRKILKPLNALAQLIKHKTGINNHFGLPREDYTDKNWGFTTKPTELQLNLVSQKLNEKNSKYYAAPYWNTQWLQWRFFSNNGPQQLLFTGTNTQNHHNFAIISIGTRKGLLAARILEANLSEPQQIKEITKILKKIGCTILLTYTADLTLAKLYTEAGLKFLVEHPTEAYFYHKNKQGLPSYIFNAGSGDFGLEAITN